MGSLGSVGKSALLPLETLQYLSPSQVLPCEGWDKSCSYGEALEGECGAAKRASTIFELPLKTGHVNHALGYPNNNTGVYLTQLPEQRSVFK